MGGSTVGAVSILASAEYLGTAACLYAGPIGWAAFGIVGLGLAVKGVYHYSMK